MDKFNDHVHLMTSLVAVFSPVLIVLGLSVISWVLGWNAPPVFDETRGLSEMINKVWSSVITPLSVSVSPQNRYA